jgi:hypothetical protein
VGQRANPRGAAHAGPRGEQPLHPPLPEARLGTATESDPAHLPPQSRARDLGRRSLRCPDAHLQDALRAGAHHPRPARAGAPGRHGAPHGCLDVAPAHRGDRVWPAALRFARGWLVPWTSLWRIWRAWHAAAPPQELRWRSTSSAPATPYTSLSGSSNVPLEDERQRSQHDPTRRAMGSGCGQRAGTTPGLDRAVDGEAHDQK